MIIAKGSSFDGNSDGTSDVFADVANLTIENMSANGTVDIKNGIIFISKATAAAITLNAPTAGGPGVGDDGKTLSFVSTTAAAHVITSPVDGFNAAGSSGTATFAGAAGNEIVLKAYNGHWYVQSAIGINEFATNASAATIQSINTTLLNGTDPVTITISTITVSAVNTALATVQTQLETILNALR